MRSGIVVLKPSTDEEWASLCLLLNSGLENPLLSALIEQARTAGARSVLVERNYIDRDFSAAYSAFYASLFRPYRKHCHRAHFFSEDLSGLTEIKDPATQMQCLEDVASSYLGNVVLRPLPHAPVSAAYVSANVLSEVETMDVDVRSTFKFHVMGVELSVETVPVAQQDTRTGACAQAAMWMAGRHFHNRHRAPWYSMPDITSVALNPADQHISRSLPAGSDFLTPDNMVRALRGMGRHPVMYAADFVEGAHVWQTVDPSQIVTRYVDSGIPVILGMQNNSSAIGHGVLAVGTGRTPGTEVDLKQHSTSAAFVSHFLVNDDQRGAYCKLPVHGGPTEDYPFCFATDIKFVIVPLPEKVFVTAEVAELIAQDFLTQVGRQRHALAKQVLGLDSGWNVEPDVFAALGEGRLVARTYLTYGWKYKARALRNGAPKRLQAELMHTEFPRYVWVTEYSEPDEMADPNPCSRLIRAHVVVDATGSRFWDSVLLVDAPGLSVFWHFDSEHPTAPASVAVRADTDAGPYYPKIRGTIDYGVCKA